MTEEAVQELQTKVIACFLICKSRLRDEKPEMLKYLTVEHETYQVEEIVYKSYGVMLDKCWDTITMEDANFVKLLKHVFFNFIMIVD